MISQKVSWIVTPAKAGVQNIFKLLDSGFRRNDKFYGISTFFEFVTIGGYKNSPTQSWTPPFIIPYRVQYPAACCEVFVSRMGIPRSLLRGSSF